MESRIGSVGACRQVQVQVLVLAVVVVLALFLGYGVRPSPPEQAAGAEEGAVQGRSDARDADAHVEDVGRRVVSLGATDEPPEPDLEGILPGDREIVRTLLTDACPLLWPRPADPPRTNPLAATGLVSCRVLANTDWDGIVVAALESVPHLSVTEGDRIKVIDATRYARQRFGAAAPVLAAGESRMLVLHNIGGRWLRRYFLLFAGPAR